MNFMLYSFRLALGQRLKSRGFRFLLLLTAALLVLAMLPGRESHSAVRVGLVLPRECGALETLFLQRSSELVEFIPTDSRELEEKILTGAWDCGLVGRKDLMKRLEAGENRDLLTLVTGPGSAVYPIVRETAAACLLEMLAPSVARNYLSEKGGEPEKVDALMSRYQMEAPGVQVRLETVTGEQIEAPQMAERSAARLVAGLTAVTLLAWALYLMVDMGRWLESPGAVRLSRVRSTTQLLFPQLAAGLAPGLLLGAVLLTAVMKNGWPMISLGGFCLVLLGLGLIVSRIGWLWRGLPVLIPFLVLLCLVFEPVVVDAGMLFPRVAILTRWLPVGLFLRGCEKNLLSVLMLMCEGAGLILLSASLDGRRLRL